MKEDIKEFLNKHSIRFKETDDFESIMPEVDAIYMTRIQNEYASDSTSEAETFPEFHLKTNHMSMIQTHCAIMHPLPRRYEIDVRIDKDPRAAYWRQERCGMWIRAALISYIFQVDGQIMDELS